MATKREGPLKIHLVHGAKNHFLTLSLGPDDCSDVIGVGHLAAAAEQATQIPADKQRLIFKGKSLTSVGDGSKSLRALGLRDGAKVMLLGSKPTAASSSQGQGQAQDMGNKVGSSAYREDVNKLQAIESSFVQESSNLKSLMQEVEDLKDEKNSAAAPDRELEQMRKRLMASSEVLMRLLESLDTLRFDSDDATSRAKRKTMVNQIHALMDQSEALSSLLKERLKEKK